MNLLCLLKWNNNFYQTNTVSPIREDATGSDEEDNIGEEVTLQPVGSPMVSPFCHTADPEPDMQNGKGVKRMRRVGLSHRSISYRC
jgi:hypothetical protein